MEKTESGSLPLGWEMLLTFVVVCNITGEKKHDYRLETINGTLRGEANRNDSLNNQLSHVSMIIRLIFSFFNCFHVFGSRINEKPPLIRT